MIADILAQRGPSRIVLIMGSPYSTDLLYHDDFQRLDAEQPRFNYLTAISRERQADHGPPLYVQDRLATHRDLLEPMLASPRTLIYICGLAGMELGILQHLAPLPPAAREGYIHCDSATLADVKNWKRSMLHKEIKTTRRVFLEVY
jgi:ferredoxin--NADP+ reductase